MLLESRSFGRSACHGEVFQNVTEYDIEDRMTVVFTQAEQASSPAYARLHHQFSPTRSSADVTR